MARGELYLLDDLVSSPWILTKTLLHARAPWIDRHPMICAVSSALDCARERARGTGGGRSTSIKRKWWSTHGHGARSHARSARLCPCASTPSSAGRLPLPPLESRYPESPTGSGRPGSMHDRVVVRTLRVLPSRATPAAAPMRHAHMTACMPVLAFPSLLVVGNLARRESVHARALSRSQIRRREAYAIRT